MLRYLEKILALTVTAPGDPAGWRADIIAVLIDQTDELVAAIRCEQEHPLPLVFILVDLRRRVPFGLRLDFVDLLLNAGRDQLFTACA